MRASRSKPARSSPPAPRSGGNLYAGRERRGRCPSLSRPRCPARTRRAGRGISPHPCQRRAVRSRFRRQLRPHGRSVLRPVRLRDRGVVWREAQRRLLHPALSLAALGQGLAAPRDDAGGLCRRNARARPRQARTAHARIDGGGQRPCRSAARVPAPPRDRPIARPHVEPPELVGLGRDAALCAGRARLALVRGQGVECMALRSAGAAGLRMLRPRLRGPRLQHRARRGRVRPRRLRASRIGQDPPRSERAHGHRA